MSQKADEEGAIPDLARLDLHRQGRAGIPEAVLAEGKSLQQVVTIAVRMAQAVGRALITRLPSGWGDQLRAQLGPELGVDLYGEGRLAVVSRPGHRPAHSGGVVGLLAAGSADIPVAEEARVTAQEMGCEVRHFYDVGVAGIHRLVEPLETLRGDERLGAVIVVAGMEGALPTVVKGLLPLPVIGVPTSVGYGYGGGGTAALMSMLQSCSPGLTVVNIDNGFCAGATAALIANRLAELRDQTAGPPR